MVKMPLVAPSPTQLPLPLPNGIPLLPHHIFCLYSQKNTNSKSSILVYNIYYSTTLNLENWSNKINEGRLYALQQCQILLSISYYLE